MAKWTTIDFTPDMVKRLRKRFNEAVCAGEETFIFDGHEFLTNYAHYVLFYLENKMKEKT